MQLSFYVNGDFQSVVNALHLVANLFGNDTYLSWFTVVMLFTIAALAFQANAERIFGAKTSDALWIKRVVIGTVLYSIFMVPTITLHVYDPYKNKYEAIDGIPAGVGLIAGISSMFIRENSELMETAGNPIMNFDDIGFGNGYEMLSASAALGSIGASQDQNLSRTIVDYLDKCVIQMQATGDLDLDALWNGNGKSILENIKTDYRIFSSTVWTPSNPGGVLYQCADSYQHIVTHLTQPARVEKAFKVFCSKMNFNPTDMTEFLMCRQKFRGVHEAFTTPEGFGYNEATFFASAFIAQMYLNDGINAGVERAKEIARSMATASDAVSGAMAADFMPMIQGMVATILISLFVIVALLMYVAPMDAFKFYFGLWIWYVTWILVDVVINIQVQNYAYNVFREIRETGLSLTTMFTIGDSSAQVLGWYGKARWMSMTIASMMTYAIFKFGGGAAFASFAGALGSSYASNAASQGATIGAPGGEEAQYKKTMNDLAAGGAVRTASMQPAQWFRAAMSNQSYSIGQEIGTGSEYSSQGNPMDIGHEKGARSAQETMGTIGAASEFEALTNKKYQDMIQDQTIGRGMEASARRDKVKELSDSTGIKQKEIYEMQNSNFSLTANKEQAEKLGGSLAGNYSFGFSDGEILNKHTKTGASEDHSFFNQKVNVDGKELTLSGEAVQKGGQLTVNGTDENGNGYTIVGHGKMSEDGINFSAVSRFNQSKEETSRGTMRSGFIDVDGDGVGNRYTDISYDTASGMISARGTDGKNYTFKGSITDADSSDGMIAIAPGSEVTWTAQYKDLNVNGTNLSMATVTGQGMGNDSILSIEGQANVDGKPMTASFKAQGDILPAAEGSGHNLFGSVSEKSLRHSDNKTVEKLDVKREVTEDSVESKFVRANTENYADNVNVEGLAAIINPNPSMFGRVVNAESKESIAEASIQVGQAIAKNIPESVRFSMGNSERYQNTLSGGVSGQASGGVAFSQGNNSASANGGVNAGMSVQRIKESSESTSQDKDALTYLYGTTIYNARMDADKLVESGKIDKADVDDYIASRVTDVSKELVGNATGIQNERYIPDYANGDNPLMRDNNDINDTAFAKAFEASKGGFKAEK